MKSVALITASFGAFDKPKVHAKQTYPCNLYYFDESNAHFPMHTQDNRMKAKFYKMLAHRVCAEDILIWVDGNVEICSPTFVDEIVNELNGSLNDVAISAHPTRVNPRQEANFIVSNINAGNAYLGKRYEVNSIMKEVDSFEKDYHGLYWCGLFARLNNAKVNAAFEQWFMENILWTNFDQNNFVKIVNLHDLHLSVMKWGDFYGNKNYKIHKHNDPNRNNKPANRR